MARQMVLSEVYDEMFKICDHSDINRPMSLVSQQVMETNIYGSMLHRKVKEFASLRLGKYFNISFLEYLELPLSVHVILCNVSNDLSKKTNDIVQSFESELDIDEK